MPIINKGKIITVKLGGSTMDDRRVIRHLAEDVSYLQGKGLKFVIVHGGGKEISRRMAKAGVAPKKISGLRITDDRTMNIVEQVMKDTNDEVCAIFRNAGTSPEAIIGSDGLLICERKPPVAVKRGSSEEFVDLGRVGTVVRIESDIVFASIGKGYVPIIAPLGRDESGITLNVNADTAAGCIAGSCSEEFILLTDVDGIMLPVSGQIKLAKELRMQEIQELVAKGIITEGMLPKTEACMRALVSGVKMARIVNGMTDHALKAALSDNPPGTRILR